MIFPILECLGKVRRGEDLPRAVDGYTATGSRVSQKQKLRFQLLVLPTIADSKGCQW